MQLDVRSRVIFNNSPQIPPVSRVWVGLRSNHSYCLMFEECNLEMLRRMYEPDKEEVRQE
jgi:hypothetical protein